MLTTSISRWAAFLFILASSLYIHGSSAQSTDDCPTISAATASEWVASCGAPGSDYCGVGCLNTIIDAIAGQAPSEWKEFCANDLSALNEAAMGCTMAAVPQLAAAGLQVGELMNCDFEAISAYAQEQFCGVDSDEVETSAVAHEHEHGEHGESTGVEGSPVSVLSTGGSGEAGVDYVHYNSDDSTSTAAERTLNKQSNPSTVSKDIKSNLNEDGKSAAAEKHTTGLDAESAEMTSAAQSTWPNVVVGVALSAFHVIGSLYMFGIM